MISKLTVKSKKEIIVSNVLINNIPKNVNPAIIMCSLKFNLRFLNRIKLFIANNGTNEKIRILA
jgi:hypothetical protein